MQIPHDLHHAYDQILADAPMRALTEAANALSLRYREANTSAKFIQSEIDRLAYLATRLPATYAAAHRVLGELQQRAPELHFSSSLDLGAGSGAASWAALDVFDQLEHCTLLEQDHALMAIGKRLAESADSATMRQAVWAITDLRQPGPFPSADVVIASYALNELPMAQAEQVALKAWEAARVALVIIEPGTMKGFATILAIRTALLNHGAHLLAPCPSAQPCPLPDGDWCHFAARVERTALQRRLKSAALNYEDEKYSYLIFTKAEPARASARILRHPQRQAGFTKLQLCTPAGLQSQTVTKRDKDAWRRVRKADWGDDWG